MSEFIIGYIVGTITLTVINIIYRIIKEGEK